MFNDTDNLCAFGGLILSAVGMTSTNDAITAFATILSAINAFFLLCRFIYRGYKAFKAYRAGKITKEEFNAEIDANFSEIGEYIEREVESNGLSESNRKPDGD